MGSRNSLVSRNGPPSRQQVSDWTTRMRSAFFEAVGEEDMRQVAEALLAKAKAGDLAAIKVLMTYAIGSPTVNVQNAVIMGDRSDLAPESPPPPPTTPSPYLANTPDRLREYERRAANGQSLFDPRDATRNLD